LPTTSRCTTFIALTLALAAGPLAASLHAADAATDHDNWFSFGPQFGLNLNARFKYPGDANSASSGPASGGGVNRTYDDGYVKVDSSGNTGGQTWNWGYNNASQIQGGSLVLHSLSGGGAAGSQNGDPQTGFDLAFGHDFGSAPGGRWGLQAAFDFTAISIADHQPLTGSASIISDAYALSSVTPPLAPYHGSFNGPGSLLGDSPTRTSSQEPVVITGSRTLDAQVYALRLGPYYELLLGQDWYVRAGGGLVLGLADTQYTCHDTVYYGGGQIVSQSGSGEGVSFNAGGYLEARLLYHLTPDWSLFAGAQYEYLGTFSRTTGDEQAQLDMSGTVNVLFGVQFNF
jgi:hypothetical protein